MNSSVTKASRSKNGMARRVGFHRAWGRPFPWHLGVVRESSDLRVDAMGSVSSLLLLVFLFFLLWKCRHSNTSGDSFFLFYVFQGN